CCGNLAPADGGGEHALVEHRQVEEPLSARERRPPYLVRLLQRAFPAAHQIVLQGGREALLQGGLRMGGHASPRQRATRTSASSVCLPKRARMRSASDCGGSPPGDVSSAKPLRMPSVARMSVSPGKTGNVAARRGG